LIRALAGTKFLLPPAVSQKPQEAFAPFFGAQHGRAAHRVEDIGRRPRARTVDIDDVTAGAAAVSAKRLNDAPLNAIAVSTIRN